MGSGYVGMSLAVLFAQYNDVVVLDVNSARVDQINNNQSTVVDARIEAFLAEKELSLMATLDKQIAYDGAGFVVVATPTNYDPETNRFDTSSVDRVVSDVLELNSKALIIIKSTIPVGHTKFLQEKHKSNLIIFSPEFLREGSALEDNLYPSRIIIGSKIKEGKDFCNLLLQGAIKTGIDTLFISSSEAEAVKLFANTYLAMRVSFFNELDSYAFANELDTKSIITGVSLDQRIGDGYNNPSFGYGGYCLPKDTKQLLANFEHIPQTLIKAIVSSNIIRKDFIAEKVLENQPKVVGFFRLTMKEGSNNFRSSAIQGIMKRVKAKGCKVIIYEPLVLQKTIFEINVVRNKRDFFNMSDVIVANRMSSDLDCVKEKVFTRDQFNQDI